MSDRDLRALERAARGAPDHVPTWTRYVSALEQAGAAPPEDLAVQVRRVRAAMETAPEQLGVEEGDEVWVEEVETPWIVGRWRGWVTQVLIDRDELRGVEFLNFRVRPDFTDEEDGAAISWRVRPLPEHRVRGLPLGRHAKVQLIAKKTDPWPRVYGP